MVVRLTLSIFALVLTLLGVVFTIIGLVGTAEDAEGFEGIGPVILGAGLVLVVIVAVLQRGANAEKKRRTQRTSVEVVAAKLNQYTRIGVMLTYDLTVRFADGSTHTRKVLVPPTTPLKAGERVEVVHDPAEPSNFEVGSEA